MNKKKELLVASTLLVTFGCAHKIQKKEIDKSLTLNENLQSFENLQKEAMISHAEILSPDEYEEGMEQLNEAKSLLAQKEQNYGDIYDSISWGMAYFETADQKADSRYNDHRNLLKARHDVLESSYSQYSGLSERMQWIDKDLKDDMNDAYSSLEDNRKKVYLDRYHDLLADTIIMRELTQVKSIIKNFHAMDVDTMAPKTFSKLDSTLETTVDSIKSNPLAHNINQELILSTHRAAIKTYEVMNIIKTTKGSTTEPAALVIWNKNKKINRLKQQKTNLNWDLSIALNVLDEMGTKVIDQRDKLTSLESKVKLNLLAKKINSALPNEHAFVSVNEAEVIVRMKNIPFDLNQTKVPQSSKKEILLLGQTIKEASPRKVTVVGHTDTIGNKPVNQLISKKRAINVKNILSKEIKTAPIMTKAVAFNQPLKPNISDKKRQANRRVDIIITQ